MSKDWLDKDRDAYESSRREPRTVEEFYSKLQNQVIDTELFRSNDSALSDQDYKDGSVAIDPKDFHI